MKSDSRGFSLLEVLVAMAMFSLILGVAGRLVSEYSRVQAFNQGKNSEFEAMQVALQQMLDDSRQASQILSPSGESSMELRIQRFDPSQNWFAGTNPAPPTLPSFDPANPLVEVHYYLQNGALLRDSGPPGSVSNTWSVCDSVGGLLVSLQPTSGVVIQMSILEPDGQVRVFTGAAQRGRL